MVFCCSPWSDPQAEYDKQTFDDDIVSPFPGQRRQFTKTAGNALAAAAPSPSVNHYHQQQQTTTPATTNQQYQNHSSTDGLISVTVPPGVSAGQTIHVLHSDGSGQVIEATVPQGMSTGSVFYVRAPPKPTTNVSPSAPPNMEPYVKNTQNNNNTHYPTATAIPAMAEAVVDYSNLSPVAPPPQCAPAPFAQCLDSANDTPPAHHQPSHHASTTSTTSTLPLTPPNTSSNKRLMRVQVPPGAAPGSTIHVQVPGENRLLAAQVPPNCREFHVEYESRSSPTSPASVLTPVHGNHYNNNTNSNLNPPPSLISGVEPIPAPGGGPKMLKVVVPPGVGPGSTIHVQVPNEPGRLLSAQVPPGNVKEFHVSYEPRRPSQPSSSYNNNNNVHPFNSHNYSSGNQRPNYSNNNNNNNNSDNGNAGSAVLPIVGGLATAAAAAMVFDHFGHHDMGGGGGDDDYGGDDE